MAKKSTIQIEKLPGSYPPYNVYCNSESHDGGFVGADTMSEAKDLKKTPENWCMGCNKESSSTNNRNISGEQF
jgi:hypothetical protein